MTDVLIKRENVDIETEHLGRMSCEDWGMLPQAKNYQKPGERSAQVLS